MPAAVRRYLEHAVAAGGEEALEVRLRMHGELRLGERWWPFRAEQWLAPERGFHWQASARSGPLWVRGFDRYLAGRGEMRWRLLGVIPVLSASGTDIDRSARGRLAAEAIWAPAALRPERGVEWSVEDDGWLCAHREVDGEAQELRLDVDEAGRLRRLVIGRWGNPDDEGWRTVAFGGEVLEERSFGALTVPARMVAGWWPGEERFEEGQFFRVVLDGLTPAVGDRH